MAIIPLVADLSHYAWDGRIPDFGAAKAAGIIGVVYKATEGASYQDATYAKSRKAAKDAGLLWGSFHFGTAADVGQQVENFRKTADWDDDTLLGLDFEYNDKHPSNTMAKGQAIDFLDQCEHLAKRPLTLYTGMDSMKRACGTPAVPELGKRRLWWAEYTKRPGPTLHASWTSYWLWQYTDGVHGAVPMTVAGFGACDLNSFKGTPDVLRASWVE